MDTLEAFMITTGLLIEAATYVGKTSVFLSTYSPQAIRERQEMGIEDCPIQRRDELWVTILPFPLDGLYMLLTRNR